MDFDRILSLPPYSLPKKDKQKLFIEHLNWLNTHHTKLCKPYRKIQSAYGTLGKQFSDIEDFPSLPVRIFKEFNLKSISEKNVIKTLTSSGTTSNKVSKIYLDRTTAMYQTKVLSKIVQDFIGKKRLPMIIIDSEKVIKNRQSFSARGAGILGFSNFGYDHLYLLDEDMNPKLDELHGFLEKHCDKKILLFGFTFMVWQHFYHEIRKISRDIDLRNGIVIHGGGWKKLNEISVDGAAFKQALNDAWGIKRIYNFYGMVEQVGSVFMECEEGFLHAPIFSDIIVRNLKDWSVLDFHRQGVVETLSILQYSYPGHVLVTEDLGEIYGEDDCACGRLGKYFLIHGRIPRAEIRGCSDTYAQREIKHAV